MIKRFRTFVIIGLLAMSLKIAAQNIGVQANINIIPPYTLSLSDYTQPGSNKLTVTLLLKDLSVVTHQVKLRITIQCNGFTVTTSKNYMPTPITLQSGVPEILGSTELEAYFQPEHLDFNGINKSDYLRTHKLPEGFYQFYVEVLDYNLGSLLSNKGMTVAYIVLNDPPLINLPANNTKLPANDPQTIMFNWVPRNLGSPNSAFTTEYEFRLYEVLPKGTDPHQIVKSSMPIYETNPPLTATTLVYSVAMPSLVPGNDYAFTVRAIDKDGRDLFKNNGYSDVFMFTYGDQCKPPSNIKTEAVAGGGADFSWTSSPAQTGYNINYRIKGNKDWLTESTFTTDASVYDLPGNILIEYQIQSQCGGYQSGYSEVDTVRTKAETKTPFACGSANTQPAITNNNPKKNLKVGDIFTAGGYKCKVTKISGSDGTFSGECRVVIPFYANARVPHTFTNIKINELGQMYEGKLISVTDPNSTFVVRDNKPVQHSEIDSSNINSIAKITNKDSTSTVADSTVQIGETTIIDEIDSTATITATNDTTTSNADQTFVIADNNQSTSPDSTQNNTTADNGNSVVQGSNSNSSVSETTTSNGNSSEVTFSASFDATTYKSYGSLQDPNTQIPVIKINHNLDDATGYSIMLSDKDESNTTYQKQIYPIAETVKFLYDTPGDKSVEVALLDKNNKVVTKTIITTKITDETGIEEVVGDNTFGPLKVKFDTKAVKGDRTGDTIAYTVSSCSFTLQLNEINFLTKKFNITGASLSYKYNKKTNQNTQAQITWQSNDGLDIGNIGFIQAKVTSISLAVDINGNLTGSLLFLSSLTNDYYRDFVLVKSGLSGQFSFNYLANSTGFSGNFDLQGISNINIQITNDPQSKKPYAALTGGTINKDGVLSGTVKGMEGASYSCKGLTVTLNKLNLSGSYNLKTGAFIPSNGDGNFTVSKIKGVTGSLIFDLKVGDAIVATVDKGKSAISVAGLTAKDFDITAVFTDKFEFDNANGSLSLENSSSGIKLAVSSFDISDGELKSLKISGDLSYKGLVFELEKFDYSADNGFTLSAMVKLGSEDKFKADNLKIDNSGNFTCDNIAGNIAHGSVNASFNIGILSDAIKGSFTAKMFSIDLSGSVEYGVATKKSTDFNFTTEPTYSYGHFAITSSVLVPVFPGLVINKLGGQFGFNCMYNLTKRPLVLYPAYKYYVAGLTLGIGDAAGIFALDVDPALVQFNTSSSLSIYIKSNLSVPAKKPMFSGTAELTLLYPSGQVSGSVSADIKVPDSKGWILKTTGKNQISFSKTSNKLEINTGHGLSAKVLSVLDLNGGFAYTKTYDNSGNVTSTSGNVSGDASVSFNQSFHASYLLKEVTIDGSLKIDFDASMNLNFDDDGSSGSFSGNIEVAPKVSVTVFGGTAGIDGDFKGTANVTYDKIALNLNAAYNLDLKCYAGSHSYSFTNSGSASYKYNF